ncbi:MAG: EVE domain-containing protein [Proteobacteria bacterium]|nr:EVE domain-containing protein [Pseudomonadota bacterium]
MNYWLFKSEPPMWSWSNQVKKGDLGEEWDGVRNYQARNFMRSMKLGDLGFFYHSQKEKKIVGVVEIIAESHTDSTSTDESWECVNIKALRDMPMPVTLTQIKSDHRLQKMVLVKNSRLSVQPVTSMEWETICSLGNYKFKNL